MAGTVVVFLACVRACLLRFHSGTRMCRRRRWSLQASCRHGGFCQEHFTTKIACIFYSDSQTHKCRQGPPFSLCAFPWSHQTVGFGASRPPKRASHKVITRTRRTASCHFEPRSDFHKISKTYYHVRNFSCFSLLVVLKGKT